MGLRRSPAHSVRTLRNSTMTVYVLWWIFFSKMIELLNASIQLIEIVIVGHLLCLYFENQCVEVKLVLLVRMHNF